MPRSKSLPNAGDRKIQIIDLARTMAIAPVLAVHLAPTFPPPGPPFQWAWEHFQRNGRYGVCLFFMISGFLITRILDSMGAGAFQPDWKGFYVRRAGRILPPFFLSVLLGLGMVWISLDDPRRFDFCFKLPTGGGAPVFWVSLFLFLFNWAAFWLMPVWQGVGHHWALFWSLAVEEQFYLFYPLVLKALRNEKKLACFLIPVIVGGPVWRWAVDGAPWARGLDSTLGSFGYFDQIAIGILLYFSQKRLAPFLAARPFLSSILCFSGFSSLGWVYFGTNFNDPHDWVYAPTLLVSALFLFLLGGMNLVFFESRFLRVLGMPGKYSYGNYLFHIIVLYYLNSYLLGLDVFSAFLVFMAVSTVLSAASFRFFELPINRWVRKAYADSPNLSRRGKGHSKARAG